MTGTFRGTDHKCRDMYTSPCDMMGPAKIISNNTDDCDRWDVYITVGRSGNCIFGPYRVSINTSNGVWCIQSADTVYDLRMGNGVTEEEGKLKNRSTTEIYHVLKKVCYK